MPRRPLTPSAVPRAMAPARLRWPERSRQRRGPSAGRSCVGRAPPGASRRSAGRCCCASRSSTSRPGWSVLADAVVVHEGLAGHPAWVAGLGDAPLAVLAVLGPPEEVGVGQADLAHDRRVDEEAAPRSPLPDRPVALLGQGEDEGRLFVLRRLHPQLLEAVGLGHDVVVHDPAVGVGTSSRSSAKARAQPPAGPRFSSDRKTPTGREPVEVSVEASTGGLLAMSTTCTAAGGWLWPAMALRQRCRDSGALCVEHHRQGLAAAPGVAMAPVAGHARECPMHPHSVQRSLQFRCDRARRALGKVVVPVTLGTSETPDLL